jgi:predicted amino acid-binding ACT domain protein
MMNNSFLLASSLISRRQAGKSLRFFSSKQLIINAVGSDRLGIMSDMTKFVTDAGGNVGDSQAAKLGSNFSLMMLVEVPEDNVKSLMEKLSSMKDMNASVHDAKKEERATPKIGCTYPMHCSLMFVVVVVCTCSFLFLGEREI